MKFFPALYCCVPINTDRRLWSSAQVLERIVVRRDHACTRTGFDRHVAYRHALFHIKRVYSIATILNYVTRTAVDSNFSDDGENDVLCAHPIRNSTIDVNRQCFRFALQQALGRENVPNLGRADAEGEGTECSMRTGMAVAADDCFAGLRRAEFRPYDVHDAPMRAAISIQVEPEVTTVLLHLSYLVRRAFGNHFQIFKTGYRRRRNRMIDRGQSKFRMEYRQTFLFEQRKRLWRRYFMNNVQVNIQNRRCIGSFGYNHMVGPNFVKQTLRHMLARLMSGSSADVAPRLLLRSNRFITSRHARLPASTMSTLAPRPR